MPSERIIRKKLPAQNEPRYFFKVITLLFRMEKKKNLSRKAILIILGLILIINFIGIVIESLVQFGIIHIDSVSIRKIFSPATILSLAFIIVGAIFWIKFYKNKKEKLMFFWNTLGIIGILIILYKLIQPTVLSKIPYYFIISPVVIFFAWFVVFKYLKKSKPAPDRNLPDNSHPIAKESLQPAL